MMNLSEINGFRTAIKYHAEIEMFRGEFVGLNDGADSYASNIVSLNKEGVISLKIFRKACQKRGIEPKKEYSGKFNVRVPVSLHSDIVSAATASGKSLNSWIVDTSEYAVDLECLLQ